MVLKEIKNKQTVEFWINVGRTAVPLILAAAMFFTPAGSALAIAVATGSTVTDISASIWDFHDARISNELAYSSAIGNEFSSTSMASADFQYGMALFNVVLSAISIGELTKSVNQYKKFNSLSEEGKKVLANSKVLERSRLLEGLSEADLNKLGKLTENQVEKISKLSNEQIVCILNNPHANDIIKQIDELPVEKFDDNIFKEIYTFNDKNKRIEQIKVEFNYNKKYDETEFSRQLANQEKGMNELTVAEYLQNRERYIAEGRAIEGNAAQKAAREKAFVDKVDELQDKGLSLKEAEIEAHKWLDTQAALHNPDQIAGGTPGMVSGMGNKNINSSIGSQWKYRINDLDEQIREISKNMSQYECENTYLDVKLIY